MTAVQNHAFRKNISQKQSKFQWGVAQASQTQNQKIIQNAEPDPTNIPIYNISSLASASKTRLNPNSINFNDLPVKQSQIISPYHKQRISQYVISETKNIENLSHQNRETVQRLNQLKNQFQILKGMMIDSSILQNNQYEKTSNLSKSNVGSVITHQKIGQVVRNKDRISKNSKVSSSSYSSQQFKQKQLNNIQNNRVASRRQKVEVHDSKIIEQSKHSQHRSQNPRTGRSQNQSRAHENSRAVGFGSKALLQKHSLEMQLRNSLQKIQILVQNQIILKTRNHELQEIFKKYLAQKQQPSEIQNKKIKQLTQKIYEYQQRIQNYKHQNYQFVQKIGKLQADKFESETRLQSLKRQKAKQSSGHTLLKLSLANLQIDNKRLKMQKDMEVKHLQYQIERLTNQNQLISLNQNKYVAIKTQVTEQAVSSSSNEAYHERIRQLEEELQQKQKKHKQAIQELNNKITQKQQSELMSFLEVIQKQKQSHDKNALYLQINKLKNQLTKIKNDTDLTQSQFGIESKVISLQYALKRDQQEKQRHVIELQKFKQQFGELKSRNKMLETQNEQKSGLVEKQKRQIYELKLQTSSGEAYKHKLQEITKVNENLIYKIQQMESLVRSQQQFQGQLFETRENSKKKQYTYNQQLKDARRRVDQAEFQAFKAQQQNKININLLQRKQQSQIQILKQEIKTLANDRDYYKNEYFKLREQNQNVVLRIKDLQLNQQHSVRFQSQQQYQQKQRVNRRHQEQLNLISQKFTSEQQKLLDQINRLTNSNQSLSEMMKNFVQLQNQNLQLKALCKDKISSNSAVLHLWDIKQIQYNNINEIVKSVNSSFINKPEIKIQSQPQSRLVSSSVSPLGYQMKPTNSDQRFNQSRITNQDNKIDKNDLDIPIQKIIY